MLSIEVRKIAEKTQALSDEDKQWLMQQLSQQLTIPDLDSEKLHQRARNIISETLIEVLTLPDNCYEEIWQKFDDVCNRLSQEISE
ncbi:MAG TPA: hypothetical protein V6C58_16630 [Allocoleopsis sp.]